MFSNKFSKILSVGSGVVISAGYVTNTSVSAEKFNWWLLFLYFFGINTQDKDFNNLDKKEDADSCRPERQDCADERIKESNASTINHENNVALESEKDEISVDTFNSNGGSESKNQQRLDLSHLNDNSLENSKNDIASFSKSIVQEAKRKKEEAEREFSSIEDELKELYKKKGELETEVQKEKNSGKNHWECQAVRSDLINVCEEIGEIIARISFFRDCVNCKKVGFLRSFCERTAMYCYKFQKEAEQSILDNGVIVHPEREGYTKGFKNTDSLINITWQLETCRLRLRFSEDKIDEKKMVDTIDIRSREDIIKNSVPFSEIASSAIYYLKNRSQQGVRL